MKKLQVVSVLVLLVLVVAYILNRLVIPFPDWLVRVVGLFMLVSIFTTAFSTAKIVIGRK